MALPITRISSGARSPRATAWAGLTQCWFRGLIHLRANSGSRRQPEQLPSPAPPAHSCRLAPKGGPGSGQLVLLARSPSPLTSWAPPRSLAGRLGPLLPPPVPAERRSHGQLPVGQGDKRKCQGAIVWWHHRECTGFGSCGITRSKGCVWGKLTPSHVPVWPCQIA